MADEKILTVADLTNEANAAMDRMSNSNPNKQLIYKLGSALVSLSDRYTELAERHAKFVDDMKEKEQA